MKAKIEVEEMTRKLGDIQNLLKRKTNLLTLIEGIDNEIKQHLALIRPGNGGGGKRVKTGSLGNYITRVMAPGAHATLKGLAKRVQEAGYVSEGAGTTLRNSIYTILMQREDVTRVRHGVYVRKTGLIQEGNGKANE